jgi:hypothetical protein
MSGLLTPLAPVYLPHLSTIFSNWPLYMPPDTRLHQPLLTPTRCLFSSCSPVEPHDKERHLAQTPSLTTLILHNCYPDWWRVLHSHLLVSYLADFWPWRGWYVPPKLCSYADYTALHPRIKLQLSKIPMWGPQIQNSLIFQSKIKHGDRIKCCGLDWSGSG